MIKAIIFDIGGVIVKNKVEEVYRRLSKKLSINYKDLIKLQKKYKNKLLTGKISAKSFSKIIEKKFNIKDNIIKKWKESYLEVMPINNELISFIKKLKKNYKIACISNAVKFDKEIDKLLGVPNIFDVYLRSYEIGFMKPQKSIFLIALKKLRLDAKECIFIDDRKEHLIIPKKMNFKIINFKNNKQLKKELVRHRIKL